MIAGAKLVLEHRTGDLWADDRHEYLIQLFVKPWDDGRIGWVDFKVAEVIGYEYVHGTLSKPEPTKGPKFFQRRGSMFSPDPVYDVADAELAAEGFAKCDGCTQFDVGSVHVDHRGHLEALLAALTKARELAAGLMTAGGRDNITSEYKP